MLRAYNNVHISELYHLDPFSRHQRAQEKLVEAVENMDADEVERLLDSGLTPFINKSIDELLGLQRA